ncbi:hypothetical protein ACH5RR_033893 [Cinchona calisaya]|uniref:Uncharacterized protein n=1 Tax=Cinchona calisaya TaxID=153742 RepID=A0ABD2YCA0_9GENT
MTPLGSRLGQSSTPPLGSSSNPVPLIQSNPDTSSTDPKARVTDDTRVLIWPNGSSFGGMLNIARTLYDDIIKPRWPEKATNWTSTLQQTRDLWWKEFQEIYKIFKKKAGNGRCNAINKAKQKNMKPS